MKDITSYSTRVNRLGRMITHQVPPPILVMECWLVIRAYGIRAVIWQRIRNWFVGY